MKERQNFYFRYHRSYSGSFNVFKVFSSECFNDTRRKEYDKDDLIEGDVIEHSLSHVLDSADPRIYGVIKSYDGKAYAVSFNDQYNSRSFINYDGSNKDCYIDTKVIPIDDLSDDYVTITSNIIANGFSGPSNDKYRPYKRCHSYLSTDAPMYEIDELYLEVMRIAAYYYKVKNDGAKGLVVTGDEVFLENIGVYSFSLFNHNIFDESEYYFKRTSTYKEENKGIILCREKVAKEYLKHGYEVLRFKEQVKKKEKVRERKNIYDRY